MLTHSKVLAAVICACLLAGCSDKGPSKGELCRTLLTTDSDTQKHFSKTDVSIDEFCTCFHFEMAHTDRAFDTKYTEVLTTLIEVRLQQNSGLKEATRFLRDDLNENPGNYSFDEDRLLGLQQTFQSISEYMEENNSCRVYTP